MRKITLTVIIQLIVLSAFGQWQQMSSPSPADIGYIANIGNKIFTAGPSVFTSSDTGNTWQQLTTPTYFNQIFSSGSVLAASNAISFQYSLDTGSTWINMTTPPVVGRIAFMNDSMIFVAGSSALYCSKDTGSSWVRSDSGMTINSDFSSICAIGPVLIATTAYNIYRSVDGGHSWNISNTGIIPFNMSALIVYGSDVFAGLNGGVYISSDSGQTWTARNNGLPWMFVTCFTLIGNNLFVGMQNHGIAVSNNQGANWTPVNNGLYYNNIKAMTTFNSIVLASIENGGIYSTDSLAQHWESRNRTLIQSNGWFTAIACIGHTVFASGQGSGIYVSYDDGVTWNKSYTGLTNLLVNDLMVIGTDVFAATGSGVFLSTDSGHSWTPRTTGIPNSAYKLTHSGSSLFAGSGSHVYVSTDYGLSWNNVSTGLNNSTFVLSMCANSTDVYLTCHEGVFHSPNNVINWTPINNGIVLTIPSVDFVRTDGQNLYAADAHKVFGSTNGGTNWTLLYNSNSNMYFESFEINNGIFYCGDYAGSYPVYVSYDSCYTWIPNDTAASFEVTSIGFNNDYVFRGESSTIHRRSLSQIVGINKLDEADAISIYPNPAHSKFKLSLSSTQPTDISIFDMTGKLITSFTYERDEEIELGLKTGIYLMSIKSENKIYKKKFTVID